MSRRIILASASPRRQDILQQIGINFEVIPSDYEEDMTLRMPPEKLVMHLAHGKAFTVAEKYMDAIVIGADTIVVLNGKIIGKPHNEIDAIKTLEASGNAHMVLTGLSVMCVETKQQYNDISISKVTLHAIPANEIRQYVATKEPLDKAGSYSIQGMAARYVEKIDGDFFGVVGLPPAKLWRLLRHFKTES